MKSYLTKLVLLAFIALLQSCTTTPTYEHKTETIGGTTTTTDAVSATQHWGK